MRHVIKHTTGFLIWCAILVKLQNESYKHGLIIGRAEGSNTILRAYYNQESIIEADRKFWDRVRWS